MARGRFVSKAISLDEKVDALCDDTCRLLFTWLITHLDCEGRMYGDSQTVKSTVFPRRKDSVKKIEKYLVELESRGLILRYFVDGNQYLCMKNFEKHQVGLRKTQESASQIPPLTTELKRGESVLAPTQVKDKVKVKEEDKEEDKEEVKENTPSLSNLSPSKEDVFDFYRKRIGKFSKDMEEKLELAISDFSAAWVVDAIKEAVKRGKKDWRYIARILENWRKFGKNTKSNQERDKYIRGKYGSSVRR